MNSDGDPSAHGKPCVACRKRKVKCNKTRPCSNCSRSKQLCTYEGNDVGPVLQSNTYSRIPESNGDVSERLAKLEALMATMLVRDSESTGHQTSAESLEDSRSRRRPSPLPQRVQPHIALSIDRTRTAPVGQIVFQEGYAAYFDSDFWPGLIAEVCRTTLLQIIS